MCKNVEVIWIPSEYYHQISDWQVGTSTGWVTTTATVTKEPIPITWELLNDAYNACLNNDNHEFYTSIHGIVDTFDEYKELKEPLYAGLFIGEVIGYLEVGQFELAKVYFRGMIDDGEVLSYFSDDEHIMDEVTRVNE